MSDNMNNLQIAEQVAELAVIDVQEQARQGGNWLRRGVAAVMLAGASFGVIEATQDNNRVNAESVCVGRNPDGSCAEWLEVPDDNPQPASPPAAQPQPTPEPKPEPKPEPEPQPQQPANPSNGDGGSQPSGSSNEVSTQTRTTEAAVYVPTTAEVLSTQYPEVFTTEAFAWADALQYQVEAVDVSGMTDEYLLANPHIWTPQIAQELLKKAERWSAGAQGSSVFTEAFAYADPKDLLELLDITQAEDGTYVPVNFQNETVQHPQQHIMVMYVGAAEQRLAAFEAEA